MMNKKMFKTLIAPMVAMCLGWVINRLEDEEARELGRKGGRWLTDNCREIMGESWEQIESRLQGKILCMTGGLYEGVDYDD